MWAKVESGLLNRGVGARAQPRDGGGKRKRMAAACLLRYVELEVGPVEVDRLAYHLDVGRLERKENIAQLTEEWRTTSSPRLGDREDNSSWVSWGKGRRVNVCRGRTHGLVV